MSLKQDITDWFGGENKWAGDLDGDRDGQVDCVLAEDEIVDHTRWGVIHDAVYLRKTIAGYAPLTFTDEYVRVRYTEPATESQDWSDFDAPIIEEVEPVEVTVIQFKTKG